MSEIPFPGGLFIVTMNSIMKGVPVFGFFLGLAFAMSLFFIRYDCRQKNLPEKPAFHALLLALVCGMLGARFFSIMENLELFWVPGTGLFKGLYYLLFFHTGLAELYPQKNLYGFYELMAMDRGMVFYGGFIFGLLAVLIYFKSIGRKLGPYLDTFSMAILLAYGIGRWGCMISGDGCFGQACPIHLPPLSIVYGPIDASCNMDPAMQGSHPIFCTYGTAVWNTPLMESGGALLVFFLFLRYGQHTAIHGLIPALSLIYYAVARFLVEFLRLNDAVLPILKHPEMVQNGNTVYLPHISELSGKVDKNVLASFYKDWHWYGLTNAQAISLILFAIGTFMYLKSTKFKKE